MAYLQHNDSGVVSSPETHDAYGTKVVPINGRSPEMARNNPLRGSLPAPSGRAAPELVYTSSSYDRNQERRPISRASSVHSNMSSIYEDHFNDLRMAAQLGKILLDRTRKLECDLDTSRRETLERDKEIKWLRDNQVFKDRTCEEQDQTIQNLQADLRETRLEYSQTDSELDRVKAHLAFQEQRTADLESQLQKELQWRGYYTTGQTQLPGEEGNGPDRPPVAQIHQKMQRGFFSEGDLNAQAEGGSGERRHISAEAAFSQSRMDAEIEEMQLQHLEEIAAKKHIINELELLLDDTRVQLSRTETREKQLEEEKQLLIQQVQEHAVTNQMQKSANYENELASIDAKQVQYDRCFGKFEKILESIDIEQQRNGMLSEATSRVGSTVGSNAGLNKTMSYRMPVGEDGRDRPPMLARYLSVQDRREAPIDLSKRRSNTNKITDPIVSPPARPEFAFERDFSTLTVIAADDHDETLTQEDGSVPKSSSPVKNHFPSPSAGLHHDLWEPSTEQPAEDDEILHSVSQGSSDDDADFESAQNGGPNGLSEECSQDEPEYKKLFQELFELIHTVIPEEEQ